MGGVVSAVTDVVGGAVEAVGDAVEDVGQAVVDNVVEPIAKTVENTLEAAAADPIGTAAKIAAAATMNPAIIAATNAAVAVANGASLEDAALAAGKGYAAGLVAQGVATELQPEFAQSGNLTSQQATAAANVAGQVASTAVTGADPLAALVNGGLNAGVSAAASDVPGFSDMTPRQQAAVTRAITATLQGKDPSQSLINTAIGAGIDAAKNADIDFGDSNQPKTTEELVNQTTANQTAPTQQEQLEAPVNPTEQDMNDFYKSIGIEPESITPDTKPAEEDPLAGIETRGDYDQITGRYVLDPNGTLPYPLTDASGTNIDSLDGYTYDRATQTWTTPDGETIDLSYLSNTNQPLDTNRFKYLDSNSPTLGDLAQSLLSSANKYSANPALATLGAVGAMSAFGGSNDQPTFNIPQWDLENQNVNWNAGQPTGPDQGVVYGQAQLNPEFTKAAQGGIMSLPRYSNGGGIATLGGYAAGGNPRLLRGPGDGMSDNIPATIAGKQPARLADGEFVVPADVVSHLGNGSTEAGANVLYQMMERVRKARTGNPKQGKQINAQKFIPNKGK